MPWCALRELTLTQALGSELEQCRQQGTSDRSQSHRPNMVVASPLLLKKAGFESRFLHALPLHSSLGKPPGVMWSTSEGVCWFTWHLYDNQRLASPVTNGSPEPATLWPTVGLAGIKPRDASQPLKHSKVPSRAP